MKLSNVVAVVGVLLFALISGLGQMQAQTIQSNYLVTATGGQVQVTQINPNTAWTECLSCGSRLIAWCSATCTINTVIDKIAASNSEDIELFQVVRYTNGTFAAFNRLGLDMCCSNPATVIFDWGTLSAGEAALLNALNAG